MCTQCLLHHCGDFNFGIIFVVVVLVRLPGSTCAVLLITLAKKLVTYGTRYPENSQNQEEGFPKIWWCPNWQWIVISLQFTLTPALQLIIKLKMGTIMI